MNVLWDVVSDQEKEEAMTSKENQEFLFSCSEENLEREVREN